MSHGFSPVWFIQDRNDRSVETQNLIYAILEAGMELHCEKYIPFGGMDYSFLPKDRPVIAHGSITMIRNMLREPFYPCAWCDFKTLTCRSYYSHWGKYLLQTDYGFYPLAEVYRLQDTLYKLYGEDSLFIKPDENSKMFTGEVVAKSKFDMFKAMLDFNGLEVDTLCVVSKPKKLLAEYRLIIGDGKVITGSLYKEDEVIKHEEVCSPELIKFAEEVVAVWSPHPIFCLDVALIDEGYRVVECGSVNCCGFYACNLRKVVEKMAEIAIREWSEYNAPV